MAENVVVITGLDPQKTLDTLRALDDAGTLELRAAAHVHRDANGRLSLDHETGDTVSFTDRHPRLGPITLLLGPLDTLLFGWLLVRVQSEELPSQVTGLQRPPGQDPSTAYGPETRRSGSVLAAR